MFSNPDLPAMRKLSDVCRYVSSIGCMYSVRYLPSTSESVCRSWRKLFDIVQENRNIRSNNAVEEALCYQPQPPGTLSMLPNLKIPEDIAASFNLVKERENVCLKSRQMRALYYTVCSTSVICRAIVNMHHPSAQFDTCVVSFRTCICVRTSLIAIGIQ